MSQPETTTQNSIADALKMLRHSLFAPAIAQEALERIAAYDPAVPSSVLIEIAQEALRSCPAGGSVT